MQTIKIQKTVEDRPALYISHYLTVRATFCTFMNLVIWFRYVLASEKNFQKIMKSLIIKQVSSFPSTLKNEDLNINRLFRPLQEQHNRIQISNAYILPQKLLKSPNISFYIIHVVIRVAHR